MKTNSAKLIFLLMLTLAFLAGCEKKHEYSSFSSRDDCLNLVYLNHIHKQVTNKVCSDLDYPTAAYQEDNKQISKNTMLLCIRERLGKVTDFDFNSSLRRKIINCAKTHGNKQGNAFATDLLQIIPSEDFKVDASDRSN